MAHLFRVAICLFFLIEALALAQTTFTVKNTLDSTLGSLRWAVNSANAVGSGAVIINFDAATFSTAQTITLTSGALPTITKSDVTITGPGASLVTISGNNGVRVFSINSGIANVAMSGLTIANGQFSTGPGGCIRNSGQLSLTGCVISQCVAGGVSGAGGGIYNDGTLVVDQCTISRNSASTLGGAIFAAQTKNVLLTVSRSTFTANTAAGTSCGDAIFIDSQAVATISDSTFYNNGKVNLGNAAITSHGTTSIQRCTIFANYGTGGTPGGIQLWEGTTTIDNSIIYGNLGTGLDIRGNGLVVDNGYNIIGTADFTPASTTLRSDPLLAALADNGGPTQTCALGIGSPAINAANPTWIGTTDQRGLPQVGPPDIGAFEFQFTVTNSLNGGSGSLRWAINAANAVASGAVIINFDVVTFSIAQTILLTSRLPTITKSDLTIIGPGASLVTINGQDTTPIFFINSGITNVIMLGLTIAQGMSDNSYFDGGCIANNGQLSVTGCVIAQCTTRSYGDGGGILNAGTLVIDSCTFSGNSADGGVGGAIQHNGVSLTVSRSTFITNTAGYGGHAINNFFGSATITDSTFYNNGQLEMHSTAISSRGTTFIKQCTITANYGDSNGFPGGLAVYAGTTTIENNIIYGNLGAGPDVLLGGIDGGTITDKGYNIIGTSSGFTRALTNVAGDPLLVALADNGGPTMTCALGSTSPAINAANPTLKNTPDQRRLLQVGRKDIGAFEVQSGSGGGDPSFVGFMGQKFGFAGKPNKSFHIFSDPYITINSRFAVANPSKFKGTVMYAFGIRWENHTVTFGVDSFIKNKEASLLISIDGRERILPRSNQPVLLDNCVNTTWSFPKLRIITALHNIVIDWRSEHNDHINGSYLNIRIDAPLDNPTLCGGILGQTASSAKNVKSLSKKDSDFITSDDMISSEAKTSKFSARPMLCAAVPTQPPSTAVAAHEHDL